MTLTEKQWVQLAYDRLKADLNKLDTEHSINCAVHHARRAIIVNMFSNVSDRLDEIEAKEKRNE